MDLHGGGLLVEGGLVVGLGPVVGPPVLPLLLEEDPAWITHLPVSQGRIQLAAGGGACSTMLVFPIPKGGDNRQTSQPKKVSKFSSLAQLHSVIVEYTLSPN